MNILGINGGPNHEHNVLVDGVAFDELHDASVALVRDGNLVFALEEERPSRIKHANYFPKMAIEECITHNCLEYDKIDFFAFAFPLGALENLVPLFFKIPFPRNAGLLVLKTIFKTHTNYDLDLKKIKLYDHHYCHALSAFGQSGFTESLVVTLDGSGDGLSGTIYSGIKNDLKLLKEFPIKKSLDYFYLEITKFLGMGPFDEYKIMGLASYGDSTVYAELFKSFYTLLPNGDYHISYEDLSALEAVCSKREKDQPLNQDHINIAGAL